MKKLLYCLTFCCLSIAIAAQNDYVVNKKGDTINGKLRKTLGNKMRLQTAQGDLKLAAADYALYHDARRKQTFCSRVLPGQSKPEFIERLIEGAITMYASSTEYDNGMQGFTSTTWYAEKDGTPLGEIKVSGFRGGKKDRKDFFRSLIADNPSVLKKFEEDNNFQISFLMELVREYNQSIKP